jgi:uncharacterized protein
VTIESDRPAWDDAPPAPPFEASRHRMPAAPVPAHHDVGRPLVLCAWDSPNMDTSLFNVCSDASPVTRPKFDVFARWLATVVPPGGTSPWDVEGVLFQAVPGDRAAAIAPFITAVRQSGLGVFCRDREEGDIDDALDAFVRQRLSERVEPGTLVLATGDQPLARWVAGPAAEAGWHVVIVAYREICSWPADAGYDFLDPEEIPGLFEHALDRFNLEALPDGGAFAPSTRPVLPAGADLSTELGALIEELTTTRAGKLSLSHLGSVARERIADFDRRNDAGSFTELVRAALEGRPYDITEAGTPSAYVTRTTRPDDHP